MSATTISSPTSTVATSQRHVAMRYFQLLDDIAEDRRRDFERREALRRLVHERRLNKQLRARR